MGRLLTVNKMSTEHKCTIRTYLLVTVATLSTVAYTINSFYC